MGGRAGKYLDRKFHKRGWTPCFPAGTMLKTPDGWKAVEVFRAGDEVVSRPEFRPEADNTVQKVTRLLTRSGKVLTLFVNGRVIETTHEHPFWVIGKGWTTANNLKADDEFLSSDKRKVVLERIIDEDRYVAVYNLEVEKDHTYFVGGNGWGFDVWSHNHTSTFELPTTWRSAKGVSGTFSDGKHKFRIDTNNLSPGERFHVHVYNPRGAEIAVIQGSGTNGIWRTSHRNQTLSKPSEVPSQLRTDIRRLVRNALNHIE